jgi:hypothetical protein
MVGNLLPKTTDLTKTTVISMSKMVSSSNGPL